LSKGGESLGYFGVKGTILRDKKRKLKTLKAVTKGRASSGTQVLEDVKIVICLEKKGGPGGLETKKTSF